MIHFLASQFLWFLPLGLLPLIMHLIFKQRKKRIYFSSLFLLKKIEKDSIEKLRIKEWILLIIRMLIIFLLVLAFAQPVLKKSENGIGKGIQKQDVYFVLDNSYSMHYRSDDGLILKNKAEQLFSKFIAAHANDFNYFVIHQNNGKWNRHPVKNQEEWEDYRKRIDYSIYPFDLEGVYQFINQFDNERTPIVLVASDFQQTGNMEKLQAEFYPVFLYFSYGIGNNAGFNDLQIINRAYSNMDSESVQINLHNYSRVTKKVQLMLSNDHQPLISKNIIVKPESDIGLSLSYLPPKKGWNEYTLKLSPDEINEDNFLYYTNYISHRFKIGLISSHPDNALQKFMNAFKSNYNASFRRFTVEDAASSDLQTYPVMVVNTGLPDLLRLEPLMAIYVRNGGNLIILPDSIHSASITQEEFLGITLDKIITNEIPVTLDASSLSKRYLKWKPFLMKNPVFFKQYFRIRHSTGSLKRQFYLKNQDGVLYENLFGKGHIHFWVVDANPVNSNLLISPFFLDWLKQILIESQGQYTWVQNFYTSDQLSELIGIIKSRIKGRMTAIDPKGRKNNIAINKSLPNSAIQTIFTIPGIYHLYTENDTLAIAINFPFKEFSREQVSPEVLKKLGKVVLVGNLNEIQPMSWLQVQKIALTPYLLILILVLFIVEILLAYNLRKKEG